MKPNEVAPDTYLKYTSDVNKKLAELKVSLIKKPCH